MFKMRDINRTNFRPCTRSNLHMQIGKLAFTWLRWCSWHFSNVKYTSHYNIDERLPLYM
ncbi:MAG: hypothetical protein ABFC94_07250 [Syntrophomonas sp.]